MYIRTKDGVYVLSEAYWAGNKDEIIAQADTIEALCDRFVFIDKKYQQEKNRYQVYTRLFEKKNLPKYIQNGTEIYGAIWCEWGLKYVAKLDDKGEWHLL